MRLGALLASLAVLAVAACATPDPAAKLPDLRFTHLDPIRLDVAEVDIVSTYDAPFASPNVEHLMPIAPEAAAITWARDRLEAAGSDGRARFVVKEASVTEERIEGEGGLKGMFTTEQSERYEATLAVALQVIGPDGRTRAEAEARAWRSRTVAEDVSLNDRERMWFELTERLMADLNTQLETNIHQYLGKYRR